MGKGAEAPDLYESSNTITLENPKAMNPNNNQSTISYSD